jgi:hypothetical protein
MTDDTQGGLTVSIDAQDIQQLMTHGTSTVTKDIGPIQVKIRCKQKMRTAVIASGPDKDPEEMDS